MGHTESNASVDVAITATYAYNHFDKSSSRHPRMRFGTAHIFNNFYESDSTYGVGATCSSHGLVEGNYFYNTRYPLAISYGTSAERPTWSTIDTDMFSNSEVTKGNCTETGYLRESNNYYIYNGLTTTNGNGGPEVLTKDDVSFNWTVPYSYTLLDVQEVPGTIARYAGINILSVNLPTSYNKNTVRYNYSGTVN
jgi:pectate lyase